jgi:heme/copper-type cytochrome/quinol oxidase subunit 3
VAFCSDISLGFIFPPQDIIVIEPLNVPLYNTFLLILSGFTIT